MNLGGFSWNRLLGISAAKSRISRKIGIPLTRSGRQRKFGAAAGCIVLPGIVVVVASAGVLLLAFCASGGQAPIAGFERVTVQTKDGPVSVTLPRREYQFEPQGNTYHVSPYGDDAAGGSAAHPWRSMDHALAALQPGDLLYLRAGDYPPFVVTQSGQPERPIIISAYAGERARIVQPEGWQREHIHEGNVVLQGAKHVWIHGLEVEGCLGRADAPENDTYGQNGITLSGGAGEGIRILNNIVSHAQHCGIKEMGHGGTHFLIEGNVVFENGIEGRDHGLYIPSQAAVIRGNAIFRNAGYGIHLYSDPKDCHVYSNVCFENGACGIIVSGPSNVIAHNVCARNAWAGLLLFRGGCTGNTFVNNLFLDNKQAQVAMDNGGGAPGYGTPANNVLDYNLAFPDAGWALPDVVATWAGAHSLVADPRVADAKGDDFTLLDGSPCTGAARETPLNGCNGWKDIGLIPAAAFANPTW